jgi:hypothetical protein
MIASRNAAHGFLNLVFLSLLSVVVACAGLETQQEIRVTLVPITDIKEVEGNWEGLVKNVRTGKESGQILLMLTSHDAFGTYNFGGETARGSLVGTGRVTLQSGRLLSDTGERTVVLTLCLRGRERVLAAHAFGKDGNPYYMELTQMK